MSEPRLRWNGSNAAQKQADEAWNAFRLAAAKRRAAAAEQSRQSKRRRRKSKSERRAARLPEADRPFRGTYKEYLSSPQWAKKKREAHAHFGGKCCCCGSTYRLQLHHKHYRTLFRETMADLELLCIGCHENQHEDKPGVADPMTREFLRVIA